MGSQPVNSFFFHDRSSGYNKSCNKRCNLVVGQLQRPGFNHWHSQIMKIKLGSIPNWVLSKNKNKNYPVYKFIK